MLYRVFCNPGPHLALERRTAVDARRRVPSVGETEGRGQGDPLDEDGLYELLRSMLADLGEGQPPRSDAAFALAVRAHLPLTRREAADRDLWTFLNLTVAWPYAAWRWGRSGTVGVSHLDGRLDRSALGRLWWMAELCKGRGDDEADDSVLRDRVEALLRNQDRAVQLYERPRLLARPGLTDQLTRQAGEDWNEEAFRTFARICGGTFGVRLTKAMDAKARSEHLDALAREARDGG